LLPAQPLDKETKMPKRTARPLAGRTFTQRNEWVMHMRPYLFFMDGSKEHPLGNFSRKLQQADCHK
jgi:hypothetical protein